MVRSWQSSFILICFVHCFFAFPAITNLGDHCNCGPTLDTGGKCYALLVGLNNYSPNSHSDVNLKYPESEVKEMAKFLCDQKYNIKMVTAEDAIVSTVKLEIRKLTEQADSNSRILFYFSGHGSLRGDSTFAIVLGRTGEDPFENRYLSADTIASELASSAAFQKVLLIDACYAGGTRLPPRPIVGSRYNKLSRHAFLSITTWNDTTWDNLFTPELLYGMERGADEFGDRNGYVDAGELCKYIDKRMVKLLNLKTGDNRRPIIALLGAAGDFELFKVNVKTKKCRQLFDK